MRMVLFPLVALLVRDQDRRARIARETIRLTWCGFIEMMSLLGTISYEWQGRERLQNRRGMLVLANHPSLIDVVFLVGHIPRTDCIIKASLFRNPFTSGPVSSARYICNDDDGEKLIANCIQSIRNGYNLIIFPEGTRTRRNQPMHMQRGAANVAVRGRIDVTPIVVTCIPPTLLKNEPWYRVPPSRPHFIFRVEDDIPVQPFIEAAGNDARAARQLTEALHSFFSSETSRHAGA